MEGKQMSTKKEKAWDYALGIIKVDGLEPSPEFLELVEKEKRGEITTNDIIKTLNERYKMKEEPVKLLGSF
jgi:Antitoxin VbhA